MRAVAYENGNSPRFDIKQFFEARIYKLKLQGGKHMSSIAEIKKIFAGADVADYDRLIEVYKTDEREGVHKIVESFTKKKKAYEDEKLRMYKMFDFERKYGDREYICGIDEVGRGPLAGPVVAAAVVLPKECDILYLNDSKQLSPKRREQLYDEIMDKAVAVGVGMADQDVIDDINILNADYEAMKQAISKLSVTPQLLLNDAVNIPGVDIQQVGIIKGDTLSASIAAASIIAKVTRDRLMVEYDSIYPGYGFAKNMGYGTAEHIKALETIGPCTIHRKTFITKFV